MGKGDKPVAGRSEEIAAIECVMGCGLRHVFGAPVGWEEADQKQEEMGIDSRGVCAECRGAQERTPLAELLLERLAASVGQGPRPRPGGGGSGSDPRCSHCGNLATCFGSYESPWNFGYGCDDCCGHGNEDGWCEPPSLWLKCEGVRKAFEAGAAAEKALRTQMLLEAKAMAAESGADAVVSVLSLLIYNWRREGEK